LTLDAKEPERPSLDEIAGLPGRPAQEGENARFRVLYLKSYLLMRAIIGFTGVTLPIVLILVDHLLDPGAPAVRFSLSGYYYSGARDLFVGALVATGVFLISYRVFETNLNNVLTIFGGIAALGVAFFPTDRFEGSTDTLTPLQAKLGEGHVAVVHFASAGVLLATLAILSFTFGIQEGRRGQQRPFGRAMLPPSFWRWYHIVCALLVLVGFGVVAYAKLNHVVSGHLVLIGEIVAVEAFGLSWLFKGLELPVLLGTRGMARRRLAKQRG
jgi:hypothetical protein